MAKPYKIPDFKKLYPETKDEIIAVLKISERKMQYQEYDLKNEQIVIDMEKQTVNRYSEQGRFLRADERSRCTVQGRRTRTGGTGHPPHGDQAAVQGDPLPVGG